MKVHPAKNKYTFIQINPWISLGSDNRNETLGKSPEPNSLKNLPNLLPNQTMAKQNNMLEISATADPRINKGKPRLATRTHHNNKSDGDREEIFQWTIKVMVAEKRYFIPAMI
jgi:hypothetical protein